MHVPYACRHSGACCSSGWAIPIEHARVAPVGMLRGDGSWLRPAPEAPATIAGVIAHTRDGRCVFRDEGCEIQRALGHAALPSACQHFPREVLIDARGAFVTLSHYCPTAADLLFDHDGPIGIVEGPPAVPVGDPEGLDARGVLPPLLSDGVLMDLEGYSAWEAHLVHVLTSDDGRTPEDALATLGSDLGVLQQWRPGGRSLSEAITRLPASAAGSSRAVPPITAGPGCSPGLSDLVIRRYLAARAFASWMAYQAGGMAAVLTHLRLALAVLREHHARAPLKESIRQTDLKLMHLMARDDLVARCRTPR